MKKILSIITLAVLMVALAGSCTKNFEERLDKTEAEAAALKAAIGKYGNLQSDIAAVLDALKKDVGSRPASEQQSIWNCINALQNQKGTFEAAIKTLQTMVGDTTVTAQIDAATAELISEYSLDSLAATLQELKEKVNAKYDVTEMEKKVAQLQGTMDIISNVVLRISGLRDMIQSVSIAPSYSDGSIGADEEGLLTFRCIVSPAEALSGEKDLKGCFTLYPNFVEVLTKGRKSKTIPILSIQLLDRTQGVYEITADVTKHLPSSKTEALTVALDVKTGSSDFITGFVKVTAVVPEPKYVEIAGLRWATKNLGAEKVTDYGDYFAWGETAPYYEGTGGWPTTPTWKSGKESGYAWQSYCGIASFSEWSTSPYDATTKILKPEFDAAAQILGDGWRMPTSAEFKALYDACGGSYDNTTNPGKDTSVGKGVYWCTNYDGVAGCLFCDGTNKLFFPAAGGGFDTDLSNAGSLGYYWSSSLNTDYPDYAYYLHFDSDAVHPQRDDSRCYGFSVRPVSDAE